MAIKWAFVFSVLESIHPGSFSIGGEVKLELAYYFLFTTVLLLSPHVGYGDITLLTAPANSFSLLEAVTGQFYIAILNRQAGWYTYRTINE